MGILTKWIDDKIENPEVILNVMVGNKIECKIRMKRKMLIDKVKKIDSNLPILIDYFEAEEVNIDKEELRKLIKEETKTV